MNSPATDARRFLSACALGFVLGIFYGALRPMRRRFPRTADLFFCAALVPELENLGFAFGESKAVLSIQGGKLSAVTLSAAGEVPFLVTTIPLSFHAELNIP